MIRQKSLATWLVPMLVFTLAATDALAKKKVQDPPPDEPPVSEPPVSEPPLDGSSIIDLETMALRIPFANAVADSVIPAGSSLTPVTLHSADPETFTSDVGVLGSTEALELSVDGVILATALPELHAMNLHTNVGDIGGLIFSSQGASYFIPRTGSQVAGVSYLATDSSVNPALVTGVISNKYGFFPAGATPVPGEVFYEVYYGTELRSVSAQPFLLFDADATRGTADPLSEEQLVSDYTGLLPGSTLSTFTGAGAREVIAHVRFNNGGKADVQALQWAGNYSYGISIRAYVFDIAALGQRTLADIAVVDSVTDVDHAVTWSQFGFASPID